MSVPALASSVDELEANAKACDWERVGKELDQVSNAVLPVLSACSESSASETKSGITYAARTPIGDGTVRTYVVRDSRGVPTSVGVELSESALRGLTSQTGVASPLVP